MTQHLKLFTVPPTTPTLTIWCQGAAHATPWEPPPVDPELAAWIQTNAHVSLRELRATLRRFGFSSGIRQEGVPIECTHRRCVMLSVDAHHQRVLKFHWHYAPVVTEWDVFEQDVTQPTGDSGNCCLLPVNETQTPVTYQLYLTSSAMSVTWVVPPGGQALTRWIVYASPRVTMQWCKAEDRQTTYPMHMGDVLEWVGSELDAASPADDGGVVWHGAVTPMLRSMSGFATEPSPAMTHHANDWHNPAPTLVGEYWRVNAPMLWYEVAIPTTARKRKRGESNEANPDWVEFQRHWKRVMQWSYEMLWRPYWGRLLYDTDPSGSLKTLQPRVGEWHIHAPGLRRSIHASLTWLAFVEMRDPFQLASWWQRPWADPLGDEQTCVSVSETVVWQWMDITAWIRESGATMNKVMLFLSVSVFCEQENMLSRLLRDPHPMLRYSWCATMAGDLMRWDVMSLMDLKKQLRAQMEMAATQAVVGHHLSVATWMALVIVQSSRCMMVELLGNIQSTLDYQVRRTHELGAYFRLQRVAETADDPGKLYVMPMTLFQMELDCETHLLMLHHQDRRPAPPSTEQLTQFWETWIARGWERPSEEQHRYLAKMMAPDAGVVHVLHGDPGCGKTAVGVTSWVMAWMDHLAACNEQFIVLAPTGRAFNEIVLNLHDKGTIYMDALPKEQRDARFLIPTTNRKTRRMPPEPPVHTLEDLFANYTSSEISKAKWIEIVKKRIRQFYDNEVRIHQSPYCLFNNALSGTVHRFLVRARTMLSDMRMDNPNSLHRVRSKPLFFVVDEMSMKDMVLFGSLTQLLKQMVTDHGFQIGGILLTGDPRQLPPIQYGAVFDNMVHSWPEVAHYRQVHRQKAGNIQDVVQQIIQAMDNRTAFSWGTDRDMPQVHVVSASAHPEFQGRAGGPVNDEEGEVSDARMQTLHRIATHMRYEDQFGKCAIIAAYQNVVVNEWNQYAQHYWRDMVYPRMFGGSRVPALAVAGHITRHRKLYMLDRVVRIKNHLTSEDRLFANGDDGLLVHMRFGPRTRKEEYLVFYVVRGQFEWVDKDQLREEFRLAYALTAHKLQGSTQERILLIEDASEDSRYHSQRLQLPYVVATRPRAQLSIYRNDVPTPLVYRYDHPVSAFFNRAACNHTFVNYEKDTLPRYVMS